MAHYKIVKDINTKDLEEEVFNFSHYQLKSHFFKRFMNELKKQKSAMRNKGGTTVRLSRINVNSYFCAWIDKKKNTLYMKHVTSGNGWPRTSMPKTFVEQDEYTEQQMES